MIRRNIIIYLIGGLFILIGISAIINTIYQAELGLAPILWLSYITVILIGIGVLIKSDLLILSQLNIMAIPFIFWSIDFFYILLNGGSLFGIADYFFIPGPLIGKLITSQHLFTVPLALYALYLIKIESNASWIISFFQVSVIFFVTRLISSPEENINCVFRSCINIDFVGYYPLIWFVSFFAIIYFTNFVLINISFLRKE